MRGWITIRRAKELVDAETEEGEILSRRQFMRRVKDWDKESSGRLLRWRGKRGKGGTLEVNAAALRQFVRADPVDRERELSELHERISVMDNRTRAQGRIIRKHGETLQSHEKALDALNTINAGQRAFNDAMAMAKTKPSLAKLGHEKHL